MTVMEKVSPIRKLPKRISQIPALSFALDLLVNFGSVCGKKIAYKCTALICYLPRATSATQSWKLSGDHSGVSSKVTTHREVGEAQIKQEHACMLSEHHWCHFNIKSNVKVEYGEPGRRGLDLQA